jgi:LPS export ABC transporter protein LptC
MDKQMRKLFITAYLVLFATVAWNGCSEEQQQQPVIDKSSSRAMEPDQVTSDARIYLYNEGRRTTDIRAERIDQYTQLDSTIAYGLNVDFYDSTGSFVSNLEADSGYIREKQNYLAVSGNVVVISADSARLETQFLTWDAARDSVVTDSFVTITRGDDILTGYGLVTDPRLETITIKRQVSGKFHDAEATQ